MLTPEQRVKKYIQEHPAPARGLVIDIVEYKDRTAVRFYRDNFNNISDDKQQDVVEWLRSAMENLNVMLKPVPVVIEMEAQVPNEM